MIAPLLDVGCWMLRTLLTQFYWGNWNWNCHLVTCHSDSRTERWTTPYQISMTTVPLLVLTGVLEPEGQRWYLSIILSFAVYSTLQVIQYMKLDVKVETAVHLADHCRSTFQLSKASVLNTMVILSLWKLLFSIRIQVNYSPLHSVRWLGTIKYHHRRTCRFTACVRLLDHKVPGEGNMRLHCTFLASIACTLLTKITKPRGRSLWIWDLTLLHW
jgi:hypothetical protein